MVVLRSRWIAAPRECEPLLARGDQNISDKAMLASLAILRVLCKLLAVSHPIWYASLIIDRVRRRDWSHVADVYKISRNDSVVRDAVSLS